MHKEKPLNLPDVDRELGRLKHELLERIRELSTIRSMIEKEEAAYGPEAPWVISARKHLEERKADGQGTYNQYCRAQRLSTAAQLAAEILEDERECPHCRKLYHGN